MPNNRNKTWHKNSRVNDYLRLTGENVWCFGYSHPYENIRMGVPAICQTLIELMENQDVKPKHIWEMCRNKH